MPQPKTFAENNGQDFANTSGLSRQPVSCSLFYISVLLGWSVEGVLRGSPWTGGLQGSLSTQSVGGSRGIHGLGSVFSG